MGNEHIVRGDLGSLVMFQSLVMFVEPRSSDLKLTLHVLNNSYIYSYEVQFKKRIKGCDYA